MAENLGSKFTIDITDLKAGLAQANRLIRQSESEFLEAAAGMEDWADSADGLKKRVETLSDQIEIQKGKVNALIEEKERIVTAMQAEGKSNEEIEKAVDGVNKAIQREGKQLETMKKKLKQSEKSLSDFESASDDAADGLDELGDESADTRDAVDKLTDVISAQQDKIKKLTREYSNMVLEQGEGSDGAKKLKRQIESLTDELKRNERQLSSASEGLDDLGDGAKKAGDGFKMSGGAIAGFVAGGVVALVGAVAGAVTAMFDLAESTRETRTNIAKLKTAFETSGKSAKAAAKTYDALYGVLGDEDQATEAATHLAKLVQTEEELADWTKICTGVYATFGDSLPIEGLTEAANETAKTGEVTGGLADALNWVSLGSGGWQKALGGNKKALAAFRAESHSGANNADAFSAALAACSTEAERQALITSTLTIAFGDAAVAYEENNAAVIEANKATAEYNAAMAELGGEVEPLNTAMTNLKTTLVSAVTPAVAGLANKTATLITNMIEAWKGTDLLSEEQRAAVTAAEEAATAYKKTKDAAWKLAESQLANVDYATVLIGKLQGLVDENGKVKEGEEARAEFIMGELNKALGTEYTQLDQIFDKNGQIKESIYGVIEARRAQIMLAAYEETYAEAVKNVAAVERARAIQAQELVLQEEVAAAARQKAIDMENEYYEMLSTGIGINESSMLSYQRQVASLQTQAKKEEGILAEKQAAYNETEGVLYDHYATIERYEDASTAAVAGNSAEVIKLLDRMGKDGFKTAASTARLSAEEQKAVLRQQVIDTEVNARLMKEAYEQGVEGVTAEMVATAEEQARAAKEEFYTVGGEITKGIAEGAEEEEWTLTDAMSSLVSSALAAAKKAAGIKSPSRLFKAAVGKNIGLGVAGGVDESTADVVKSIDKQVNAALRAYDVGEINAAITSAINTSAGHKNGSYGLASGSNGVTIYQTNNYSQAHSRYEIYKSKQDTAAAVRLAMQGA